MSPADSQSTSPATSSRIGTSTRSAGPSPSALRNTVAVLLTIALSFSAARLERFSWMKRSSVEIPTMLPITTAASTSSVNQEMLASTVSSRLKGLQ